MNSVLPRAPRPLQTRNPPLPHDHERPKGLEMFRKIIYVVIRPAIVPQCEKSPPHPCAQTQLDQQAIKIRRVSELLLPQVPAPLPLPLQSLPCGFLTEFRAARSALVVHQQPL